MVDQRENRRGGWSFRPDTPITGPLDFTTQVAAPTDGPPVELHLVYTDDGLYVPAIVRKPPGSGPFPTIVAMHGGSGGLGISWLVDFVLNQGYVLDRFLDAGYAVCFTEGRMEIEDAYGMESVESTNPPLPTVLDHEDVVATYQYLQEQSFVDDDRIGFFGVSHGGELQMKLISELGAGPAALVALEPAVIEYLGLQYDGPRTEANLQFNDELDDSQIDFENAWQRIQAVNDDVPILVGGRDADHLQGLFRKLYDLLDRSDKTVEWASWDHDQHAYQWGPRRTETVADSTRPPSMTGVDTRYDVDPLTKDTIDRVVSFLNNHVRND